MTTEEQVDPAQDYEALKAEREAKKSSEASPADAAGNGAAQPAATAAADAAQADPMPHPIEEYQAYKAWKARRKSKGGKGPAVVAESEGGLSKPKAAHAGKFKPATTSRRSVLLSLGGLAWLLFTGFLGAMGAVMGRFLFPNVLYEPPTTFKIGPPSLYLPDSVDNSLKSLRQIWVVRDELGIYVLKAVCTHLGCTPAWLQSEQKFKCPCHGSGFRMNGMNFEGPAPRPLERYSVSLADDGQILVDTSKVFLQPADWTNPAAYIPA